MASQGGEDALGIELVTCCDGGPASGQPAHPILAPDGPIRGTRDASGYPILPGLGSSAVPAEETWECVEEGSDGGDTKEVAAEEHPAPRAPSPVAERPAVKDDDIRAFPFSIRLWMIVEDQSFKSIYWSRDGESIIIQANFFKSEVLGHKDNQRIFGTDSLRKFVCLLNLHGFRKLYYKSACLSSARNRVIAYRNHNFQRDQPQLMNNIRSKGRQRPPAVQTRRRRMEPTRSSPRLHPVAEPDWDCRSGLRVSPGLLAENKTRSSEDGACDTQARPRDLLFASSEEAGPHGQRPPGTVLFPSAEESVALTREIEGVLSHAEAIPGLESNEVTEEEEEVPQHECVSSSSAFPSALQKVQLTGDINPPKEGISSSVAFPSAVQNVPFPEDSCPLDCDSIVDIVSIALNNFNSMEVDGPGEGVPSAIENFILTEEGGPHVPGNILVPSALENANPTAEAEPNGSCSSALCSVNPMEEGGLAEALPSNTLAAPATAGPDPLREASTDLQGYNTLRSIFLAWIAMGPHENPGTEDEPETPSV